MMMMMMLMMIIIPNSIKVPLLEANITRIQQKGSDDFEGAIPNNNNNCDDDDDDYDDYSDDYNDDYNNYNADNDTIYRDLTTN